MEMGLQKKKEHPELTATRKASFNLSAMHHKRSAAKITAKVAKLEREDLGRSSGDRRSIAIIGMKRRAKHQLALYNEKK